MRAGKMPLVRRELFGSEPQALVCEDVVDRSHRDIEHAREALDRYPCLAIAPQLVLVTLRELVWPASHLFPLL